MSPLSVLGLAIRVDVFEADVAPDGRTPDQIQMRGTRRLVRVAGCAVRVVLTRLRQHERRAQALVPEMPVRDERAPLRGKAHATLVIDHRVGKEAVRVTSDCVPGTRREAEIVTAANRDDTGDAQRRTELLIRRRGPARRSRDSRARPTSGPTGRSTKVRTVASSALAPGGRRSARRGRRSR